MIGYYTLVLQLSHNNYTILSCYPSRLNQGQIQQMGFHFIGHFDLFWVMCEEGRPCQPPSCWPSCCFLVFFLAWFFSACSCIESGSGVNTLGFYGMPDRYYTTVKRLSKYLCSSQYVNMINIIEIIFFSEEGVKSMPIYLWVNCSMGGKF